MDLAVNEGFCLHYDKKNYICSIKCQNLLRFVHKMRMIKNVDRNFKRARSGKKQGKRARRQPKKKWGKTMDSEYMQAQAVIGEVKKADASDKR